ncbi:hypothetical protein TNCV_2152261 [Trichonephila clavipes]|nr:hypothetical protein TNCV_2152261 [Trichonephila clavipes]
MSFRVERSIRGTGSSIQNRKARVEPRDGPHKVLARSPYYSCLCCEIFVGKRPFIQGRRQAQFGSTRNMFLLGCLELISEFGPFLSQHLTKNMETKKSRTARYFPLIIDSTPDASYTDQLAVALQYASVRKACANERLVRVLSCVSRKARGMKEAALNLLKEP